MSQDTPKHRRQVVIPQKAETTYTEPPKPEERKPAGKAKKQPTDEEK